MAANEDRLVAALNTCLSLIEGGVSPSDCLAAYPQFANELSPMLHTVSLLKSQPKSPPTPQQVASMQTAYLNEVHAPSIISIFANPMALAMMVAAVTAVVIGLGAFFALDQIQESVGTTISELPTEVSIAAFAEAEAETDTITATATDTATNTATSTATDTQTATPTETETVTNTATETETATATATATSTATSTDVEIAAALVPQDDPETETVTNTATSTATDTQTATPTRTATHTLTRTPTRTPTPSTVTQVPQVAQAAPVQQPQSSTSSGGAIWQTATATSTNTPGSPEEPLGSGETDCVLADNCLLLDSVANTGLVMAGNTTTLIFSADQTETAVDIIFEPPGDTNCVAGYCTRFDGEEAVAWFTQGDIADIWHIQFWDFSADTDQDGVPDVDDACPIDADDECEGEVTELVTLCHVPQGNPDSVQTITVAEPAVEDHLAHGDTLGECPQTPEPPELEPDDGYFGS